MNDKLLNFQNNDNFNLFSKLRLDNEEDIINPYEDTNILCQYSNIDETIIKMKSKKGLRLLSWNIQSLRAKFNEFKEFIDIFHRENCFFDIIGLQECWELKNYDLYQLENYNFIHKTRTQSNGGGICYFINKKFKFKELKNLSIFEEKVIECLTIEIELSKKEKLIVSNLYRSNANHATYSTSEQNSRFLDAFSTLQADLSSLKKNSYIMGDLNYDLLKFEQHEKTKVLLEDSFGNGFLELISIPTRISNTSATLIDHLYTNTMSNCYDTSVIISDISDHFPICHIISDKQKEIRPKYVQVQNFNENDILAFKNDLSNVDWDSVLILNETQDSYDEFYRIFNGLYCEHFPITNVKFNKNKHKKEPFMTKGILKSRQTKLKLIELKIRFPTAENNEKYRKYRSCYNKVIRAAKKIYFKYSFEKHKNDMRKTWEVLRESIRKTNDKSSIIEQIKSGDISFHEDDSMANQFNDYFTTIADKINDEINPSDRDCTFYLNDNNDNFFSFQHVSSFDIIKIVKGFESKSSKDMFGISNKLLKNVIDKIAIPLAHIINSSLQTSEIPSELKLAKVIPIFKLKKKESDLLCIMSNYRPISLLPIFSKILEKVVACKLTSFLDEYKLLYKHQYGFQKKNSTIHPIIHFLNRLATDANERKITIGVFCDLQKAFDCCSHRILLIKLSKLGIKGRELKWFENYLSNRQQFVKVNEGKSNMKYVTKGVPQGSILGPLLFLIYINDLANCTSLFTLLFADDTSFLISGKNMNEVIELLNIELKKISYWFRTNELCLHPDKTKFMIFTKDESNIDFDNINIILDNNNENENDENLITKLSYVNSNSDIPAIKFLGIFIDPKLNFKYHIDAIHSKVSRSLYAINSAKHIICEKALKTLYCSLVHSHFTYCIPIWSCASKTSLTKIELLQKKAIRIISNASYNAHTVPLFKDLEILPIKEQAIYSSLTLMYDYVNLKLPGSFDNVWETNNARAGRVLRNANLFNIPFIRLESQRNFPISNFPRLWNDIVIPNTNPNDDIENENNDFTFENDMTKKQFSLKLKEYLLEQLEFVCNKENCSECS